MEFSFKAVKSAWLLAKNALSEYSMHENLTVHILKNIYITSFYLLKVASVSKNMSVLPGTLKAFP